MPHARIRPCFYESANDGQAKPGMSGLRREVRFIDSIGQNIDYSIVADRNDVSLFLRETHHLDVAVPGDRFDRILKDREQDRQNIVIIVFWKTIRHVNLELKLFPNSIAVNIGGRFQRM